MMRALIPLLALLYSWSAFSQNTLAPFSALSGSDVFLSWIVKKDKDIILHRTYFTKDPVSQYRSMLYRINQKGEVIDSFDLNIGNRRYDGKPFVSKEGRLYFLGTYYITDAFYTQRYAALEFDDDLNVVREFESPVFDVGYGFWYILGSGSNGFTSYLTDFSVYRDTFWGYGTYLLVDSPSVILGNRAFYFKAHLNGQIYADFPLPARITNCFFRDNTLYVQCSTDDPTDPDRPKAVGWYNHEGKWIRGWNFDNSTSGEFPWGACGGAIDDRLYFSYIGRDPSLPGCPALNVAIDVRDLNFKVIRRFKINECDYMYAGNMPFAKATDGSIYFQAVQKGYNKFLLQKYTPDMQLIWSKEFSPEGIVRIFPLQLLPMEDGGVLMNCRHEFNGGERLFLYRFSPNGDPVVSAQEAAYEPLRAEPSV
ncbi:MAG: hypothetical protein NZM43_12050, partial [Saprospiraceae bacterium]|nr:hypothetical protein [Saprospiraceae bacterium]MDW8485043.1 hypothetical protein [Saprospiraceae bacterium]